MEEYRTAHTVLLHRWARRFRTVPLWPVRSPVLPSPFGRFHAAASIACLLAFSAQLRPHLACKILNLFIVVYFELFAQYPLCRSRISCRECSHRKMSEVWIPACAGMTEQPDKKLLCKSHFWQAARLSPRRRPGSRSLAAKEQSFLDFWIPAHPGITQLWPHPVGPWHNKSRVRTESGGPHCEKVVSSPPPPR